MYTEMHFYVLLATTLGVLAHLGVFARGDWHLWALAAIKFYNAFRTSK